jgi:hypothetical protein
MNSRRKFSLTGDRDQDAPPRWRRRSPRRRLRDSRGCDWPGHRWPTVLTASHARLRQPASWHAAAPDGSVGASPPGTRARGRLTTAVGVAHTAPLPWLSGTAEHMRPARIKPNRQLHPEHYGPQRYGRTPVHGRMTTCQVDGGYRASSRQPGEDHDVAEVAAEGPVEDAAARD